MSQVNLALVQEKKSWKIAIFLKIKLAKQNWKTFFEMVDTN